MASKADMANKERWYAIRTKPGAQRMDRAIPLDFDEAKAKLERHKKRIVPWSETVIERDCRDAGYEVFMPAYTVEVKHHRTKQWMDKRFPLLVGYAFVNLPCQDFEIFRRKVDSALCVFKPGGKGHEPYEFSERVIGGLRLIEMEAWQKFETDKQHRIRSEELAAKHLSRREIRQMFPAGRVVRLSTKATIGGGMIGRVVGPSSQKTVKTIIDMLNNSITLDVPVEFLEQVA